MPKLLLVRPSRAAPCFCIQFNPKRGPLSNNAAYMSGLEIRWGRRSGSSSSLGPLRLNRSRAASPGSRVASVPLLRNRLL